MKRLWVSLAVIMLIPLNSGHGQWESGQLKTGAWQGTLTFQGMSLRIVFNLSAKPGGGITATMDSPDQGAKGIPVDSVLVEGAKVRFGVASAMGVYEGTIMAGADSVTGIWKQSGMTFPLTLKYVGKTAEGSKRPQDPVKPYPYEEEDVSYLNPEAGITLAGTLTEPKTGGPFPAALLITGSGPQDRDEMIVGHRPFLVLADYLTRRGIAVLRVDDRGIGKSTGNFSRATTRDFAGDVRAGVSYLLSRKEISGDRIGLIGHSEGGIIAPMVASESKDIAFIVLMAGTGLTGEEILLMQSALIRSATGASDADVRAVDSVSRRMYTIVRSGRDSAAIVSELRDLVLSTMEKSDTAGSASKEQRDAMVNMSIGQLTSPWFKFFLKYDPRPALSKLKCPVLAINGEKDLQVPPKENLREIEAALRRGGNRDFLVKELPGLNHLFQTATKGTPDEYAKSEETISPIALKLIGDWIEERVK
jgi:fermentation-respiration switch protein FrsA (DUF1100 family)